MGGAINGTETNNSCRSRIYVVASFIQYLRNRGKTDVMKPDIPKKAQLTYIPHSFTDTELGNFFHACDSNLGISNPSLLGKGKKLSDVDLYVRIHWY